MRRSLQIAVIEAMAILATSCAGPIYSVPSSAMEPAILAGDHVFVPGGEPISELRRGDVIAFHYPPDPNVILIKRLIGLPSDHLRIVNGVLVLNSRRLTEPYVQHRAGASVSRFLSDFPLFADGEASITPEGRKMLEQDATSGELVVPAGGYFVLGDNRDESYDSRSWGTVAASQVIGLVREVLYSEDPKTKVLRADRVLLAVQRGSLK